jgi:hypothetical protein
MNRREKRNELIAVRVGHSVKGAIQAIAEREQRTLSQLIYLWILGAIDSDSKNNQFKDKPNIIHPDH